VAEAQLQALQARAAVLRAAGLLSEAEGLAMEDAVADFVELRAAVPGRLVTAEMAGAGGSPLVRALVTQVALSEALPADAAFARQLRRKCL
jgi:hypothetical protein